MESPVITKEVLEKIKLDMQESLITFRREADEVREEVRHHKQEQRKLLEGVTSASQLKSVGLQYDFGNTDSLTQKLIRLDNRCNLLSVLSNTIDVMIATYDAKNELKGVDLASVFQVLQYIWVEYDMPVQTLSQCYGQFVHLNKEVIEAKGKSHVKSGDIVLALSNYYYPDGSLRFNEDIMGFEGLIGYMQAFLNKVEYFNALPEIQYQGTTLRKSFAKLLKEYNDMLKTPILEIGPVIPDNQNHLFFLETAAAPLVSYDIDSVDTSLKGKFASLLQEHICKENEGNFKNFIVDRTKGARAYAVKLDDAMVFFMKLEDGVYVVVGASLEGHKYHDMMVRMYEYEDQIRAFEIALKNPVTRNEIMASQKEIEEALMRSLQGPRKVA